MTSRLRWLVTCALTCSLGCARIEPQVDAGVVVSDAGCGDTTNDPNHCGACGRACLHRPNMAVTCVAGGCEYSCLPDHRDCDGDATNGCEAAVLSDPLHCGSCERACAVAMQAGANVVSSCRGGSCGFSCAPGRDDCDSDLFRGAAGTGCEADLSNVSTCGECRHACTTQCAASSCVGEPQPCAIAQNRRLVRAIGTADGVVLVLSERPGRVSFMRLDTGGRLVGAEGGALTLPAAGNFDVGFDGERLVLAWVEGTAASEVRVQRLDAHSWARLGAVAALGLPGAADVLRPQVVSGPGRTLLVVARGFGTGKVYVSAWRKDEAAPPSLVVDERLPMQHAVYAPIRDGWLAAWPSLPPNVQPQDPMAKRGVTTLPLLTGGAGGAREFPTSLDVDDATPLILEPAGEGATLLFAPRDTARTLQLEFDGRGDATSGQPRLLTGLGVPRSVSRRGASGVVLVRDGPTSSLTETARAFVVRTDANGVTGPAVPLPWPWNLARPAVFPTSRGVVLVGERSPLGGLSFFVKVETALLGASLESTCP